MVTTTLFTKSGTNLISFLASDNWRFLGEDLTPTTNPTASAPKADAACKSFLLVIPQILILTLFKMLIQTP